jgi:hypothetical protein
MRPDELSVSVVEFDVRAGEFEMSAAGFNVQTDRTAITTAQASQETTREGGVGNTATIGSLIAQGMKALTSLDAIMHNKYGSQPAKMAAWQTAAHIERAAQSAKPTPAPATPKT